MPKISETFNVGNRDNVTPARLLQMIEDMYATLSVAINQKPAVYFREELGVPTDADTGDTFVSDGDMNINTTTGKVEMATDHPTFSTVTWTQLSP